MDERKKMIEDLQKMAEEVLKLKKERRQKRPIVIEFSGSPKSGKTSCINSLELFFKRNGFSVKTIQERASICPVSDKQSPMFNLWTACTSLSGMIGTLEDKKNSIDVLILDRGIYDSLCWFNWLVKKGKMEKIQQDKVESFLLMDELVKAIDIVFSFTTTPETSIEREYTHLLTDKLGTIMNETVLEEYRQAVIETQKSKSKYFHKILSIDTTSKSQDEVGKEVTKKSLESLKELLIEKIGVFRLKGALKKELVGNKIFTSEELKNKLGKIEFVARDIAEERKDYIQPIPIAVITNRKRDKVLVIKKNNNAVSDSSPEKGKLLVYIGGHSRYEDSTEKISEEFISICKSTLKREVKEEIGISVALDGIDPFFIYTSDTDKSKRHLAVCFIVEQDDEGINLRLDSTELVQRKGKTKSGTFQSIGSLKNELMESWSQKILEHTFNLTNNSQISMFD